MTSPYPLRTEPLFRDYLWGGRNLGTVLGKPIPDSGVWAESWEMIDHPEHQSIITNGELAGKSLRQAAAENSTWMFGDSSPKIEALPLLLKYLDCQKVLSVQVHPDDEYGATMSPPDLGKTEAWYIVAAQPGAKLYAGLKPGVDRDHLAKAIEKGEVEECLHEIEPRAGECVFIPAGTVHALGAGLLVAEIQQASNTTFRLFDWNRVDADGNPRQLHVDQALEVIDFNAGPRTTQTPRATDQRGREQLVHCDKFILDRLHTEFEGPVANDDKFHLLTAPHGNAQLTWSDESGQHVESLAPGQSVFLPAALAEVKVQLSKPETILLDMYLP